MPFILWREGVRIRVQPPLESYRWQYRRRDSATLHWILFYANLTVGLRRQGENRFPTGWETAGQMSLKERDKGKRI